MCFSFAFYCYFSFFLASSSSLFKRSFSSFSLSSWSRYAIDILTNFFSNSSTSFFRASISSFSDSLTSLFFNSGYAVNSASYMPTFKENDRPYFMLLSTPSEIPVFFDIAGTLIPFVVSLKTSLLNSSFVNVSMFSICIERILTSLNIVFFQKNMNLYTKSCIFVSTSANNTRANITLLR